MGYSTRCYLRFLFNGLLLTIAAPMVNAAPVFSGNAIVDFDIPGALRVGDAVQGDVGMPLSVPFVTSGFDIEAIYFYFDSEDDSLYIGVDTVVITGDADGDGDPDSSSPELLALGGHDLPALGGSESAVFSVDFDQDGTLDVVMGIGAFGDISSIGVYRFEGSPYAPSISLGEMLPVSIEVFATPSAAEPDLEMVVHGFSRIWPGDAHPNFDYFVYLGSYSDAGIGEDFLPSPTDWGLACFDVNGVDGCERTDGCEDGSPETEEVCDGKDQDCDGLIDEGFDSDDDGIADCFDAEACDGEDNDGDGQIDEDFFSSLRTKKSWCDHPEVCDGEDNDGDGSVDEGYDFDGDGSPDCSPPPKPTPTPTEPPTPTQTETPATPTAPEATPTFAPTMAQTPSPTPYDATDGEPVGGTPPYYITQTPASTSPPATPFVVYPTPTASPTPTPVAMTPTATTMPTEPNCESSLSGVFAVSANLAQVESNGGAFSPRGDLPAFPKSGSTALAWDPSGQRVFVATGEGDDGLYFAAPGDTSFSFIGRIGGRASNVQAMDFAPGAASQFGFNPGSLYAISIDGVASCSPNCLFEVDPETADAQPIAAIKANQLRSMSFDPETGALMAFDPGGKVLMQLDARGQKLSELTLEGSHQEQGTGVDTVFSLAHGCDGSLYGVDVAYGVLLEIDPSTGQSHWVGNYGDTLGAANSFSLFGLDSGTCACEGSAL